jgi:peptide/nickel transport system ATP-binding protein
VTQVFGAPRDDYTRMLLAARPRLDAPSPARAGGKETIVLEARGLAKSFDKVKAVKGASFKLARGRTLGLVGESGSGKTTLGLLVARLHQASGGSALLHGQDTRSVPAKTFKRAVQIVFQNPYASLNPRFSAGEILMEPMRIHGIGAGEAERRALAAEALGRVGLPASALFKYPHEFSGGQRQRIAIARALVLKPELLICDEAVSALDVSIQAQLLNLLRDLQDEYAMSYLFISHDLAVVKSMADEVMVMKDGEIVEMAGADELYSDPKHPYTRTLLASVPG